MQTPAHPARSLASSSTALPRHLRRKYMLIILLLTWYCTDRVSSSNIYVNQPDTQHFMIEFIHNTWRLDMFPTSMVHPQERLQAVCCEYANHHIPNSQHTACKRSWGWTIEVGNMSSRQVLWINSIIKRCVPGWFTYTVFLVFFLVLKLVSYFSGRIK